jgi:hypothetical protein
MPQALDALERLGAATRPLAGTLEKLAAETRDRRAGRGLSAWPNLKIAKLTTARALPR